jgi:hypothetical protein
MMLKKNKRIETKFKPINDQLTLKNRLLLEINPLRDAIKINLYMMYPYFQFIEDGNYKNFIKQCYSDFLHYLDTGEYTEEQKKQKDYKEKCSYESCIYTDIRIPPQYKAFIGTTCNSILLIPKIPIPLSKNKEITNKLVEISIAFSKCQDDNKNKNYKRMISPTDVKKMYEDIINN